MLSNGAERLGQRRLERAVDLHDVEVRRPAARGTRTSTPSPPPTSSTTSAASELGGAADHAEDVVVDQEVLAELAVRPDPVSAQAAQAGLARLVGHHPNTRAALRSTMRVELLVGDPAQLGQAPPVCTTLAGLVGLAADGLGGQTGGVGLDEQQLGRHLARRRAGGRWPWDM